MLPYKDASEYFSKKCVYQPNNIMTFSLFPHPSFHNPARISKNLIVTKYHLSLVYIHLNDIQGKKYLDYDNLLL